MSHGKGVLLQREGRGFGGRRVKVGLEERGVIGQEARDSLKGSMSCFLGSGKLGKAELGGL